MFKCKSCGGDLIFNIEKQDMECVFCNSHFGVEEYAEDRVAEEDEVYETTVYTCTQCGAELTSQDNSAVAFCSYCGTEAVLESRISQAYRPSHIVPFKKTKEECKKIYLEKARREPYVPREFKDPQFIDKFRGIYIPYWEYDVAFNNEPVLTVNESYTSGNYRYDNVYNVKPQLKNTNITIPCDASASFDDEIANEIAPYHKEARQDFNPAYLAGFFADTADVEKEVYVDEAIGRAQDHVLSNVTKDFKEGARVDISDSDKERSRILGTECRGVKGSLYPVWFLTWRNGQRLAYGVINGETGKISAEIPVDIKTFMMVSGIIALIVFFIMTITGALILPPTVLMFADIAAFIAQYFYQKEVAAIMEKETNRNNLGALSAKELEEIKKKGRRRVKKGISAVIIFALVGILAFFCVMMDTYERLPIVTPVIFIAGFIWFIRTLRPLARIKEKRMIFGAILPVVAEFIAAAIGITLPAADWIYYLGSVVVFGALTVTSLGLILEYNLLTTRSIPDFHDRKGGNKDAGR